MKSKIKKKNKGLRRKIRSRYKISKSSDRPRLSVYRSNKHIYGQIVDVRTGNILAGVSSSVIKTKDKEKGKIDISFKAGEALAVKAKKKNIIEVVFDRSGYKYHGRIKALAEGARKGGLKF